MRVFTHHRWVRAVLFGVVLSGWTFVDRAGAGDLVVLHLTGRPLLDQAAELVGETVDRDGSRVPPATDRKEPETAAWSFSGHC